MHQLRNCQLSLMVLLPLCLLAACGSSGHSTLQDPGADKVTIVELEQQSGTNSTLGSVPGSRAGSLDQAQFSGPGYALSVVDHLCQVDAATAADLEVSYAQVPAGAQLVLQAKRRLVAPSVTVLLRLPIAAQAVQGITIGSAAGGVSAGRCVGVEYEAGSYEYTLSVAGGAPIEAGRILVFKLGDRSRLPSVQNPRHDIDRVYLQRVLEVGSADGMLRWEEYNIGDANGDGWVTTADSATLSLYEGSSSADSDPYVWTPGYERRHDDLHGYLDYSTEIAERLSDPNYAADHIVHVDSNASAPNNDAKILADPLINGARITSYGIEVMETSPSANSAWADTWYPLVDALMYGQINYNNTLPPESQQLHPLNPKSRLHIQRGINSQGMTYSYGGVQNSVTFACNRQGHELLPPVYVANFREVRLLFGQRVDLPLNGQVRKFKFRVRPFADGAIQTGIDPDGKSYQGVYSSPTQEYVFDDDAPEDFALFNIPHDPIGVGATKLTWLDSEDLDERNNPVSYRIYYSPGTSWPSVASFLASAQTYAVEKPVFTGPLPYCILPNLQPGASYGFAITYLDSKAHESTFELGDILVKLADEDDESGPDLYENGGVGAKPVSEPASEVVLHLITSNFVDCDTVDSNPATNLSYQATATPASGSPLTFNSTVDYEPGTFGFQMLLSGLQYDMDYTITTLAIDTAGNSTALNTITTKTWQSSDDRAPVFAHSPPLVAAQQTFKAGELSVQFEPATDQHPVTYRVFYSPSVPTNPAAWFAAAQFVDVAAEDTQAYGALRAYLLQGLAPGAVYYVGVRAIDSISNGTANTDTQSGLTNIFVPLGGSFTLSAGTGVPETCDGQWFARDAAGNLGFVFTYSTRLFFGFIDAASALMTVEPIKDSTGSIFCDGRAGIGFDANGKAGVAFVSAKSLSNLPDAQYHTISAQDPGVGEVTYISRPVAGIGQPGTTNWNPRQKVLEGQGANLHVEFVKSPLTQTLIDPMVAFCGSSGSNAMSSIYKLRTGTFVLVGSYPGLLLDTQIRGDGRAMLMTSIPGMHRVAISDAFGEGWPTEERSFLAIAALTGPQVSPAGFIYGANPEYDRIWGNTLSVSTGNFEGSYLRTWEASNYAELMNASLTSRVLGAAFSKGSTTSDISLIYGSSGYGEERSMLLQTVSGAAFGQQFVLPVSNFDNYNHPVAGVMLGSGSTARRLVGYDTGAGVKFYIEQLVVQGP